MANLKTLDQPSCFYNELHPIWDLIFDVNGGTRQMRASAQKYLPQHPAESQANYQLRLQLATFEPLFKVLVNALVGRAFDTEISILDESEDEDFDEWLEDIDLQGNSAHSFAQETFQRLVEYGLVYLMADFKKGADVRTQDSEKKSGARPYLVYLRPQDVIMFRKDEAGKLVEVRIREEAPSWVNDKEVKKERIRILTPGAFELWEKLPKTTTESGWTLVDNGSMTLQDIPVVCIYAQKDDCEPPLLEAAYLNVKYYQFESNHDNALTVAQFPIITATGVEEDDKTVIGPKKVLKSSNPNAKWAYLEHSGTALNCGRTRLEDIKNAISAFGLKLLMSKTEGATKTATENKIDDKQNMSALRVMANRFADGYAAVLALLGDWTTKKELDPDVSLKGAFQLDRTDPTELTALAGLNAQGKLSDETLWAEYKRRGVLADTFEASKEKELIALAGPTGLGNPGLEGDAKPPAKGDSEAIKKVMEMEKKKKEQKQADGMMKE